MKQTFAPKKRYFDPCINFDKLSCFVKNTKFNSKLIDTILNNVENAIISAPTEYSKSDNKILDMFSDLLYDTKGFLRLVRFTQYGSFYIVEVYDHVTNHFFYLAYSIYDIIDNFTLESNEKVKYIKLAEAPKDYEVLVSCVKEPKHYSDERAAINEYNKFIVTIGSENMVLLVTQKIICVSQVYRKVNDTDVSKKITGEVTFKIGDYEVNKAFSFDPLEVDNTEYQEMFNEIGEDIINTYAPYGITKWYCRDLVGYETSNLEGVLTRNGAIKFEAVLAEEPEPEEETEWNDDIESGEDFPTDDEPVEEPVDPEDVNPPSPEEPDPNPTPDPEPEPVNPDPIDPEPDEPVIIDDPVEPDPDPVDEPVVTDDDIGQDGSDDFDDTFD